ncbi:hypothetical protein DFH07DRAFT_783191 [Mycena maculata]|uniref:Uncharacterized protein n=1 Tax=Mycena maculata TaxID=230809 RepID=A0AAD7HNN3_9AGAR|nr:hypothetical protein DFH07DRAFT_783191 [Mycena maculata]
MPKLGKHLVPSCNEEIQVTRGSGVDQAARIIQSLPNISQDDFDVDVLLTPYGLDSLWGTFSSVTGRHFFNRYHPKILSGFTDNRKNRSPGRKVAPTAVLMEDWVRKWTDNLSHLSINLGTRKLGLETPSNDTVLLTGSTDNDIRAVYAWNRPSPDGVELIYHQTAGLQHEGLSIIPGVGTFGEIDASLWRATRLPEFKTLIIGTNQLLELAMKLKHCVPPSFTFISAIGVYQNCRAFKHRIQTGYTESKWVGERLVQIAGERAYLYTQHQQFVGHSTMVPSYHSIWGTPWMPA